MADANDSTTPTTSGSSGPRSEKEVFDHEAYSGLQVVGDGRPQIVSREAPEVVAAGGPPEYAEHKAFGQYPPPQVSPEQQQQQQQHNGGAGLAYQYPAQQQPGGGGPGSPYSTGGVSLPATTSAGMAADYHYHNGGNPFEPLSGRKGGPVRICGLRRKVFWVVLALVVFGLMVAIAVGLGLGLGEQNNSKSSSSTNSTAAATATTSSATSSTLPAATATATATGDTDIICPTANQTLYTLATETSKKFLVLCGRDYNSDGGATDLTSMNITTFEGCLNECGNLDGCIAVGWGNYYGTNTCWLKSGIGTPNHSQNWYAAVEDDSG